MSKGGIAIGLAEEHSHFFHRAAEFSCRIAERKEVGWLSGLPSATRGHFSRKGPCCKPGSTAQASKLTEQRQQNQSEMRAFSPKSPGIRQMERLSFALDLTHIHVYEHLYVQLYLLASIQSSVFKYNAHRETNVETQRVHLAERPGRYRSD